jgi:hypothetical protein
LAALEEVLQMQRVIDQVGVKQVLEAVGLGRVIAEMGLDCLVAQLSPEQLRELKQRLP